MLHSLLEIDGKNCENTILLSSELAELMPGVETRKKWSNPLREVWVTNQSHLCSATSHCKMLYCLGPSPPYMKCYKMDKSGTLFFNVGLVTNACKRLCCINRKKLLQEWMKQHFIQQMPQQLLRALGRINLRICVDFSQEFWKWIPFCISSSSSF